MTKVIEKPACNVDISQYRENAKGAFVPLEKIKPIDLLRDKEVDELIEKAHAMQNAIREFKVMAYATVSSFVDLSFENYDAPIGGKKGNVTLTSYDGKKRVQLAVNDCLSFDEGILAAKALIDECIHEWSADANENLRAIVDQAFDTDNDGNINTHRILALRRLNISDERWKKAMEAIADSLQVADTKSYIRFYERPSSDKKFKGISLNIADL